MFPVACGGGLKRLLTTCIPVLSYVRHQNVSTVDGLQYSRPDQVSSSPLPQHRYTRSVHPSLRIRTCLHQWVGEDLDTSSVLHQMMSERSDQARRVQAVNLSTHVPPQTSQLALREGHENIHVRNK